MYKYMKKGEGEEGGGRWEVERRGVAQVDYIC